MVFGPKQEVWIYGELWVPVDLRGQHQTTAVRRGERAPYGVWVLSKHELSTRCPITTLPPVGNAQICCPPVLGFCAGASMGHPCSTVLPTRAQAKAMVTPTATGIDHKPRHHGDGGELGAPGSWCGSTAELRDQSSAAPPVCIVTSNIPLQRSLCFAAPQGRPQKPPRCRTLRCSREGAVQAEIGCTGALTMLQRRFLPEQPYNSQPILNLWHTALGLQGLPVAPRCDPSASPLCWIHPELGSIVTEAPSC